MRTAFEHSSDAVELEQEAASEPMSLQVELDLGLRRIDLYGLGIDSLTEEQASAYLFGALDRGRGGVVLTPNLDHLQRHARQPAVRDAYVHADLVLADGMPLVWASRLQGTPLPERVAGSDMIWTISRRAGEAGKSVYMLGGSPGVGELAADKLVEAFPSLRIAGQHSPPFGFLDDPSALQQLLERVTAARPDIVFVGLPSPIAERVIERLRPSLPSSWFMGLGVTFSFVAETVKRAPRWTHGIGLEWLWRLLQEPRRLLRRYLIEGIPFALRLFAASLLRRIRGRRRR